MGYSFQENMKAPSHKAAAAKMIMNRHSNWTSASTAPSFMTLRIALIMWVRGKIWAKYFTAWGDPSRENQTSERNIIGHEIKLSTPLVNSSLVPLAARTRPSALSPTPTRTIQKPIMTKNGKAKFQPKAALS